jgi:glucosylceramidase
MERTEAPGARLYVSAAGKEFAPAALRPASGFGMAFRVGEKAIGQPLEGFGGAFNEKGWEALALLSREDRAAVLSDLFAPGKGLSLNFCRIPIGSSDYSLSRYSLDSLEDDYEMKGFGVERDEEALIPFIKAAQRLNPDMRFWASAWSPPPWMKDNRAFDSGAMRDEGPVYAAYALYLAKFARAYRGKGIPIDVIAVQNEPTMLTAYPSCGWKPHQFRDFIKGFLGPALEQEGVGIMLGTFPQPALMEHARLSLSDPEARRRVKVLGLQWGGLPIAKRARKLVPGLPVWHTETDCGNHHWEPGFNPRRPEGDFGYANATWGHMRDYLSAGSSLYSLWNMVLDEEGKSIDSKRPWPQNAPIVVDRGSRAALRTPMFYACAHFSRYLGPGARLLASSKSPNAIAFLSAGGETVVALHNPDGIERKARVRVKGRVLEAALPPQSFATLVVG